MNYPSDIKDHHWPMICHYFDCGSYGNRSKYPKKDLVNAVLYIMKNECTWRNLPKSFPPYATVYSFYRRSKQKGTWALVMKQLGEDSGRPE